MIRTATATLLFALAAPVFAAEWTLVNKIETPATQSDATRLRKGTADAANLNRFGFYSDLVSTRRPATGMRCPTAAQVAG